MFGDKYYDRCALYFMLNFEQIKFKSEKKKNTKFGLDIMINLF